MFKQPDIIIVASLSLLFALLGYYKLKKTKKKDFLDMFLRIKDGLQKDFGIPVLFESHEQPQYLKFATTDDLNDIFLKIQDILKDTHMAGEYSEGPQEPIECTSTIWSADDKSTIHFRIVCTAIRRSPCGKNTYRLYMK